MVAGVSELDEMVYSVGKQSVVVGVVVWRITAQLVSTLQHLLQHTHSELCRGTTPDQVFLNHRTCCWALNP